MNKQKKDKNTAPTHATQNMKSTAGTTNLTQEQNEKNSETRRKTRSHKNTPGVKVASNHDNARSYKLKFIQIKNGAKAPVQKQSE